MGKDKSISFRPPPGMRARIEAVAAADDRKLTWVIEKCVAAHLPELERKYGITPGEYKISRSATEASLVEDKPRPAKRRRKAREHNHSP